MEVQTLSNKYIDIADLLQLLKREFGTNFEVDVRWSSNFENLGLYKLGSGRKLRAHNSKEVDPGQLDEAGNEAIQFW